MWFLLDFQLLACMKTTKVEVVELTLQGSSLFIKSTLFCDNIVLWLKNIKSDRMVGEFHSHTKKTAIKAIKISFFESTFNRFQCTHTASAKFSCFNVKNELKVQAFIATFPNTAGNKQELCDQKYSCCTQHHRTKFNSAGTPQSKRPLTKTAQEM